MTSRLDKQKQIISLLNARLPAEVSQEYTLQPEESDPPEESSISAQPRLLNQVYHFHKSIIQNVNLGLLAIDREGEITFANKNAAKLLGYQPEALLGVHLRNFFQSGEEAGSFLDLSLLPGRKIDDWETTFVCQDGRTISVDINASPLNDYNNHFEGVILSFRDLTEIQHLRHQVERMERLALLGELSAGIAHEIRNPLAGIKAASQVLEEQFDPGDSRYQLIRRVVREVDRSNELLQEFFKFARPGKPKPAQYPVKKLIENVQLLLAPSMKKNGISYVEDIPADLQIYVDERQLEQMVLNLFLNAMDAMPGGGVLAVNARQIRPATTARHQRNNSLVTIRISDTGNGIAEEHLDKIFNPFFTTKPEGTGLGLSICSRLAEENQGQIDVISREDEGTSFILAFPAVKQG